jgi:hypothetical protein
MVSLLRRRVRHGRAGASFGLRSLREEWQCATARAFMGIQACCFCPVGVEGRSHCQPREKLPEHGDLAAGPLGRAA